MKNIIFFTCLVLSLISCEEDSKEGEGIESSSISQEGYEVAQVETFIISDDIFNNQIVSNGVIEAKNRAGLRFRNSGIIKDIYVKNGDRVKRGEVLAVLENRLLAINLDKAETEFNNSKLRLERQKINFGIAGKKDNDIEPNVLETLYLNSGFLSAKSNFEEATVLYEQSFLRAPFSGKIGNLVLDNGSYVDISTDFCLIFSSDQLNISFKVLEENLKSIHLGQPILISPFFETDIQIEGEVVEINPLIGKGGMSDITASIDSGEFLRDGMNVKVFINDTLTGALKVPKTAVVLRSDRHVVFSLLNNVAQWKYVRILAENSDFYAIKGKLEAGDTIVTKGNINLSQNSLVKPIDH